MNIAWWRRFSAPTGPPSSENRPDLCHGGPRAPARQAARHHHPAAVLADSRARGPCGPQPGGQPRPGAADRVGPGHGRRSLRCVPGRGLHDRAPRIPPPPGPPPVSPVRTALPVTCPRGGGRPRCRTSRTRPCSPSPAAPPASTTTSTGSRSPATRCAPASASPTRPPPSCSACSGPPKAARQEPHAPPDLCRTAGSSGPAAGGRFRRWCPGPGTP